VSSERCVAFMRDLERRDLKVLKPWFSEETVLWVPPRPPVKGARRILCMFRAIFRMYADIHWRVTEVHPLGGRRYLYLTESWGTIGQGTPYTNHVLTLIEFDAEGRIASLSDYFKDTAIFQCGRLPPTDDEPPLEPAADG
jgi:ketosteroid isomerase-like protein